ncbi:hypothetical protein ACSNOJ_35545 [Streptomyces sp. URMC 128]|uniref:hypothetical protein n=1 Tax=Streptomyces sp. URMC 128 TaxID=3423404 RepID=UPI003F1A47F5
MTSVIARGRAELVPFGVERGRRKLVRCQGADEERWDERFVHYLYDDPAQRGTVWLRLKPVSLVAHDLSHTVAPLRRRESCAVSSVAGTQGPS